MNEKQSDGAESNGKDDKQLVEKGMTKRDSRSPEPATPPPPPPKKKDEN